MSQMKLFQKRRFYPLFWTQFLGAFNDNFFKNALIILVTFKTTELMGIPSGQVVALAGGLFILPFFLFSAMAGQLADKYEKSVLIRWIKLGEICIMILAAAGFVFEQYELLLFVLFLMGFQSSVFGPVKYSILPQHLDAYEIVGGNALVEAGTFIAILLGTVGGGLLINVEGVGPIAVSVGLVVFAFMGWLVSRRIPIAEPTAPDLNIKWNPITPTWEIVRFMQKIPTVYRSILGISWFWLFGAALLAIFPIYCKEYLKADETLVTLFLTLFSVGIAVGSLFCERLSRKHLELGLVPLGSIGITLFTLDLFFVGIPAFLLGQPEGSVTVTAFVADGQGLRIIIDLFFLAVFGGFFIVPLYTLIQTRTEKSIRSRIIAGNNILNALFMVIGSGYLMLMIQLDFSVPEMFLTLALLNAAVAAYIYFLIPEFLLRFVIWCLSNILYRMKVIGDENIPQTGAAVLVCNHVSFVDWMIIAAAIRRPVRFIMHHSYFKGPGKFFMNQAKVIPIASAKENPELLDEAFEKAAYELRDEEIVCIFPEGKITWDGKMNSFRPGIERIIGKTPVPVIPMAIRNMWGSFFSRKGGKAIIKKPKRFWSRIEVKIGQSISPNKVTADLLYGQVRELLAEE